MAGWVMCFPTALPSALFGQDQTETTEQEKRPNWFRPTAEFGRRGSEPGEMLWPRSVALGDDERLFIADSGNHRIQIFSPEGKSIGCFGKLGSGPGELRNPGGVVLGLQGELYVADTGNDRVEVFDAQGGFLREWGGHGISPGRLVRPVALAVLPDRIAVVENGNCRIQFFKPSGEPLNSFGTFGENPGEFKEPSGIAADEDGALYVADAGIHRIQKFDSAGRFVQQWGAWGYPEGLLSSPRGLSYSHGRLYVADCANHRIQVFDRAGNFLSQWGAPGAVAHEGGGRLHYPWAIAVGRSGARAVVCEALEHRCQVFSLANARSSMPARELPWWEGLHARFHAAMFPVLAGNLSREVGRWGRAPPVLAAIPEQDSHSVLFFDISLRPCFLVTRTGGVGRRMGEFRWPALLAANARSGRFVVCDQDNRRLQVLELPRDPKSMTGFVRAVKIIASVEPGRTVPKSEKDYHPECASVDGVAVDDEGNLLVADGGNGVILKLDPEGGFMRLLGRLGRSDGGILTSVGIAASPDRKLLYVADPSRFRIVAMTPDGRVQFEWGRYGSEGKDCFLLPSGVSVDDEGLVYVTDAGQNVVKKFDSKGSWIGEWGGSGADNGQFSSPTGISFISPDRIVVEDFGNHRGQIFNRQGEFQAFFYKGGKSSPMPSR